MVETTLTALFIAFVTAIGAGCGVSLYRWGSKQFGSGVDTIQLTLDVVKTIPGEIESQKEHLDDMSTQLAGIKTSVGQVEAHLCRLDRTMEEHIGNEEHKVAEHGVKIDAVQQELHGTNKRLDTLAQSVNHLQAAISSGTPVGRAFDLAEDPSS